MVRNLENCSAGCILVAFLVFSPCYYFYLIFDISCFILVFHINTVSLYYHHPASCFNCWFLSIRIFQEITNANDVRWSSARKWFGCRRGDWIVRLSLLLQAKKNLHDV